VTDAVGFGYRWVEETRQFAHAAVIVVCTPDGRVSRYLYGIEFDPQTLRLSLVEAAKGKIGSPLDQILLFCFHYDAREGRYALAAAQLMRLGGAVTAMALAAFLLAMWRRDMRRRGGS
jgi:protein SCO1